MTSLNRWLLAAGIAAGMYLGTGSLLAQPNARPGQGGDNTGRPNMRDPEARRQFFMDQIKERLEVKDDAEWKVMEPLVQKVMDVQRQATGDRMRGMFMGRRGGPGGPGGDNAGDPQARRGGQGGMFGTPMPEAEALQRAIDGKASASEMKAALAKYQDARKAKQGELEKAQADLRKVLNLRQEAIATVSGLL